MQRAATYLHAATHHNVDSGPHRNAHPTHPDASPTDRNPGSRPTDRDTNTRSTDPHADPNDAPGLKPNCRTAEGCMVTIQAGKYEIQSLSLER